MAPWQLYQQSLEIDERLGDIGSKGATLHDMAYVLRTWGDLDGAMTLYQQSLDIKERWATSVARARRCTPWRMCW